MRKIISLLFAVIALHAYGESDNANWKTCTLKATHMIMYQSGHKVSESNTAISIIIDKGRNIIRIGNQIYNVEGKEVMNPQVYCFQCHYGQFLEKYIIVCNLKSCFIMIGSQKNETAPIKKYYFSPDKTNIKLTY